MNNSLELNPYDVLEVSPSASNAEITKAFTLAMKRKKYPLDVIAKARKSLTNPQERLQADYLRPILNTVQPFKSQDISELEKPEPSLEFLSDFDGLEATIEKAQSGASLDQQLGKTIFSSLFTSGKKNNG